MGEVNVCETFVLRLGCIYAGRAIVVAHCVLAGRRHVHSCDFIILNIGVGGDECTNVEFRG